MVEKHYGKIVSVASVAGKAGSRILASHYAASKGALIALTHSLALEFGNFGININAVAPGGTDTPMAKTVSKTPLSDPYPQISAFKRYAKPEEIAAVIAFLASPYASFVGVPPICDNL